jgi:hypothetical protein
MKNLSGIILLLFLLWGCDANFSKKENNQTPADSIRKDSIQHYSEKISYPNQPDSCLINIDTIKNTAYASHIYLWKILSGKSDGHIIYDQDVSLFIFHLNPDESPSYRLLTNKVIFSLLEKQIRNVKFGIVLRQNAEKQKKYFLENIKHPLCNDVKIDSLVSIVKRDFNAKDDAQIRLENEILNSLEAAKK